MPQSIADERNTQSSLKDSNNQSTPSIPVTDMPSIYTINLVISFADFVSQYCLQYVLRMANSLRLNSSLGVQQIATISF